jgi:hypothetical protein
MRTLSSKWLAGIAAVVVVLIVASVAVALTVGRETTKSLPESEPEGIVQRYILAVQDRDYRLAHSYLSERLKDFCTEEHLRSSSRWFAERSGEGRITLVGTDTLSDGRREVRVRITDVNVSPPFGVNEYSHEERYLLTQADGQWRIDAPPWPVGWCPGLEERGPKPPRPAPLQ